MNDFFINKPKNPFQNYDLAGVVETAETLPNWQIRQIIKLKNSTKPRKLTKILNWWSWKNLQIRPNHRNWRIMQNRWLYLNHHKWSNMNKIIITNKFSKIIKLLKLDKSWISNVTNHISLPLLNSGCTVHNHTAVYKIIQKKFLSWKLYKIWNM